MRRLKIRVLLRLSLAISLVLFTASQALRAQDEERPSEGQSEEMFAPQPTESMVPAKPAEPPDGEAYFGATIRYWDSTDQAVGDARPLAERFRDHLEIELGGKPPTLFLLPEVWQTDDGTPIPFADTLERIRLFDDLSPKPMVPFIKWNSASGFGDWSPNYRGITTRDIAAGRLDQYISQYARDVRAYGKPLWIHPICGEFNGGWWHSCSPAANPNLTPEHFVSAWRRIVDIFREEGATNVAWVWNPFTYPPPADPAVYGAAAYYPGDDYVDWAGADFYDYGPPSFLDLDYRFAVDHGKPLLIGEWGVRHGQSKLTPTQQQQWLGDMFDYFDSHPKIKAIVYFNYKANTSQEDETHRARHVFLNGGTVNYHPNLNDYDHRLLAESGADFRGTYARRIASPRYQSSLLNGN